MLLFGRAFIPLTRGRVILSDASAGQVGISQRRLCSGRAAGSSRAKAFQRGVSIGLADFAVQLHVTQSDLRIHRTLGDRVAVQRGRPIRIGFLCKRRTMAACQLKQRIDVTRIRRFAQPEARLRNITLHAATGQQRVTNVGLRRRMVASRRLQEQLER